METQSMRTRLPANSTAEHLGTVIEAWLFTLVWLTALAWYRTLAKIVDWSHSVRSVSVSSVSVRNVWLEFLAWLRRARNLARSARVLSALDTARRNQRYPLSPPPSYKLERLVPAITRSSASSMTTLVAPHAAAGGLQASLEMDPPFVADLELSDLVDDDEPTVIDHFISPSAYVIDQRRP